MSQQINLLNTALIKQKDFFSPTNIAITLGLMCVLIFGYYGYALKELSALDLARMQAAEKLSSLDEKLKQTSIAHKDLAPNKALLDEIGQLEQKEKMQQQILQTVKQSRANPDKGYAALMRAFAKQSIDGLWLTSFDYDSQSEKLSIAGRTIQADLVPEYISQLSIEPALKGKSFSALNMQLPKVADTKTSPQIGNAAGPSSPASANAPQSNTPKYIEFALQSTQENTFPENTVSVKEVKS